MCNPIYLWDTNPINTFFLNNQGGNLNERIHQHKNKKRPNEKMQLIKKQNNYKSINELLDKTLDKTINENLEVIQEQALFYVGETPIKWTTLKQSQSGDKWNQGNDIVTVLFKDNRGAFLRFEYEDEIMVEYYHFI